jgi:hypothetical protein
MFIQGILLFFSNTIIHYRGNAKNSRPWRDKAQKNLARAKV